MYFFYKFNKLLIYNRSKYYLIENINLLRLNYTSNNHSFLQSLIIARDIKKKKTNKNKNIKISNSFIMNFLR